ncbi:sensor histidine kinase [Actomonas aquatica]|uniref:histidine kinase n=1 Tax=Actomonas aquatica TaxID=2866162 RepID=A0ABZ1C881_9BACT|nr:sensor histidine kinase [Opitutus sp. WL0086]WRQ87532.1 ATP-binding protein [Opitutus sp. WL0086]
MAALGAALGLRALTAWSQPAEYTLAGTPTGVVESGAPNFEIFGPESVGMTKPAVDLHVLPDGRLLVMAQDELAIGDGVRWMQLERAADQPHINLENVAVATDGTIYAGRSNAFARLEFGSDATWRLEPVETIVEHERYGDPQLTHVREAEGKWFWWWGAGPIFAWQPGATPRVIGVANAPRAAFSLNGVVHLSDSSNGALYRYDGEQLHPVHLAGDDYADATITSAAPLGPDRTLVGTTGRGLRVWDGQAFTPFATRGLLARAYSINALCALGQDLYAAASHNLGIIFFRADGTIVQVLDRSNDHRLARVTKLVRGTDGALWALLNDGIARIDFPSRISHFEAFVDTGLAYAMPFRFDGRLWLLSDGRIQRGIYDEDNRIRRFEVDSPPGYANQLFAIGDQLLAASRDGLFRRTLADRWAKLSDVSSPLIQANPTAPGRWLYVAHDEVGWVLQDAAGALSVERFPSPGFGHAYGAISDDAGAFWVELGTGKVARVTPTLPRPTIEMHGPGGALGNRWPNLFLLDDQVRVNVPWQIFARDPLSGQLRLDEALLNRIPQMRDVLGRPTLDSTGRLWLTHEGRLQVLESQDGQWASLDEPLPAGLLPLHIYGQRDGVVWLHEPQKLARYDPAIPIPQRQPLHALIARVQLGGTTTLYPPFDDTSPLRAGADSLVVQVMATGGQPRHAVGFEYRIDGLDHQWRQADATGMLPLGGIPPGDYQLIVRPVGADGIGERAALTFMVPQPWYTRLWAMIGFALLGIGAIWFAGWVSTTVTRQRNAELDRLVTLRTEALKRSNLRLEQQITATEQKSHELEASQHEIRQLNADLEQRVHQRTEELREANRDLEAFAYSVAHDLRSPIGNIGNFAKLLRSLYPPEPGSERDKMTAFIVNESQRLIELVQSFLDFATVQKAAIHWQHVDLLPIIVAIRDRLMHDAPDRQVCWELPTTVPTVAGDPTLLQQVFTNLLNNALKFTGERDQAIIRITAPLQPDRSFATFVISDNGAGFDPAQVHLFEPFQRAHDNRRFKGTGIGLTNVHRIVTRHGGTITATGAPEQGATFTLRLPTRRPADDTLPPF